MRIVRWLAPALGLLLLGLVVASLWRELSALDGAKLWSSLAEYRLSTLAWALCAVAVSFVALTFYDDLALRCIGRPLPWRRVARISFAGHAISQALGFGVLTGGSVRLRMYSAVGLQTPEILQVVALSSLTFAFGVSAVLGPGLLLVPAESLRGLGLGAPLVRALGAVTTLAVLAGLWVSARGRESVGVGRFRLELPQFRHALLQIAAGVVDIVATAAVLYLLLPEGGRGPFLPFVVLFLSGTVLGLLSHVPAGLGVFEGTLLLLRPSTLDATALVGALAVYRVLYYVLPLVVALPIFAASEARSRRSTSRSHSNLSGTDSQS